MTILDNVWTGSPATDAQRGPGRGGGRRPATGCRVGYDDASHFNREYKRHFGEPPARDVDRLRELAATLCLVVIHLVRDTSHRFSKNKLATCLLIYTERRPMLVAHYRNHAWDHQTMN